MKPDTNSSKRRVIPASEILEKIARGEPVKYDGVIVVGDLDLSKRDLPTVHVERTDVGCDYGIVVGDLSERDLPTVHVERTNYEIEVFGLTEEAKVIKSPIIITNSDIRGAVIFGNTIFWELVDVRKTNFSGDANFRGAQFSSSAKFGAAQFSGSANFMAAQFSGGTADFFGAQFSGNADFGWAQFSGSANFMEAQFSGNANFREAQFSVDANFMAAQFSGGDASFWRAQFSGSATFGAVQFSADANFTGSQFSVDANFMGVQFSGNANFMAAQFSGSATFGAAQFSGSANFMAAQFSSSAYFGGAQFRGNANFRGAQFSVDANFHGAQFSVDADFSEAQFDKELRLDNLKLDRLYVTWNSIRNVLAYDGPAYLALIKNFKVIEQFSDADDCYYQYRKESQYRNEWDNGENWSKLLDIIAWISCGYGVRPIHTIFCMLGVVVISWIIFFVYFDSMFESFYFSLMTFTGGKPDNLVPVRFLRSVAMIEAILGYLFMALFVVVLARRLIR